MQLARAGALQRDPVLIDAIRAIAASAVVVSHADTWYMIRWEPLMSYKQHLGLFGVQLFFLLSGHLIWLSLGRLLTQPSGMREYFVRRFTRIAPLYYVSLTLTLLISPMVEWSFPADHRLGPIISHLFFAQSIVESNSAINPVVWTLTYEVLFYLSAPLLWRYRGHLGKIFAASVVLCIVGWLTYIPGLRGASLVAPSFLLGALFAETKTIPGWRLLVGSSMIAVICGWLGMPELAIDGFWALSALSFAGVISAYGLGGSRTFRIVAPLGVISYSLYIWHYVLLDIVGPWWWSYPWIRMHDIAHGALYIVTCIAVAAVSYHLIERPGKTFLRDALSRSRLMRRGGKPDTATS